MDYEQRYMDALRRAKKLYGEGTITECLGWVFPELEDENERMKREILELVSISGNGNQFEEIKDWLEKQETSCTKKDVDDAYLKGISDAKNEIEKQYEANYQIRKDIATFIYNHRGDIKDRAKWMDYLGIKVSFVEKNDEQPQGKSALESINEEKVDNANKVGLKFKVGDWISGYYTNYKVTAIHSKGYVVENTDGTKINILFENEKSHHLWTIQDAEDGDVLSGEIDGEVFVFLFNQIQDRWIVAHVYYSETDGEFIEKAYLHRYHSFSPATKEQHNLLFQKMKEAGYKWDNKKKELKRVESKTSLL